MAVEVSDLLACGGTPDRDPLPHGDGEVKGGQGLF
jgi:hypothetical protein